MWPFTRSERVLEDASTAEVTVLTSQVKTLSNDLERALESMAELELARDSAGWQKLSDQGRRDFTRDGLRKAGEQGRLMGLANTLIKRGRAIRYAYVWGQGVDISARDSAVNDVVQAFLDDEANRESFTGTQARQQREGALYDEGNHFRAHFTDPLTGRVLVRTILADEIDDIITDPEDRTVPWYYIRSWTEQAISPTGAVTQTTRKAAYPALKYQPATKPRRLTLEAGADPIEVKWDAPVKHIKVNAIDGAKFGIGDSYASLPWAMGYKNFQEDWTQLMRALARIAFITSSKTKSAAQQKRAQLQGMGAMPAGGTVNLTDDQKLEAVPKSGATIDAESGRPIAALVASGLDLPVTILLADPGQTGARATAQTLDLPTRLIFQARQELHTEDLLDTLGYVVEQAVIAPRGPLRTKGRAVRDGDRLKVQFVDDSDSTIDVIWPSLEEIDPKTMVDAIVAAEGIPDVPKLPLIKLVLQALGVRDIDELLQQITDDDGNLKPQDGAAGSLAAQAFRNGTDPATALDQ
ncbi:hypothetical protein C6401_15250 [Arthrobacter woluwensis]|uniref:hypothetical protein n=1 Tax=Arthrobacter woluwensis TaxID=156980 RepID=UPI000D121B7D|nr:hypothetical protein [Arthrobacter woluwensis]PSS42914.1 hypothetical protein C6401_15250 [Arthrobacter woluwensis]